MAQVWAGPRGSTLSQSKELKDQGPFPACLLPQTHPPPRVDCAFQWLLRPADCLWTVWWASSSPARDLSDSLVGPSVRPPTHPSIYSFKQLTLIKGFMCWGLGIQQRLGQPQPLSLWPLHSSRSDTGHAK